ncbi:MAG: hypothetical protein PHG02_07495 [Oscillospiraceae bacterium]|nr:hypothetical protein [Oscillospiraceae bacterium]
MGNIEIKAIKRKKLLRGYLHPPSSFFAEKYHSKEEQKKKESRFKRKLRQILLKGSANSTVSCKHIAEHSFNFVCKAKFGALIKRIIDLGVFILMVEHDIKLPMNVRDYIYVPSQGTVLSEGLPGESA